MKKEEENEEGQDYMSIFNIDLLSGLRPLSLVMSETTCRDREAIFTGNVVGCRGIKNVAFVLDGNVGLSGKRVTLSTAT